MEKQKIAVDIDGVIVDFVGSFLDFCNFRLGTNHRYEECTRHNFPKVLGLDQKVAANLLSDYEDVYDVVNAPIIEEARVALTTLDDRYQLVSITSRRPRFEKTTREFFIHHFPFIEPFFANGHSNPYSGGPDRVSKSRMAERLEALCLIEDSEDELMSWDSDSVQPICYAQPWNACIAETHPHILRATWPELTEYLMSLP